MTATNETSVPDWNPPKKDRMTCPVCGRQRWRQWTSYFLCAVMVLLAVYMVVWEIPDYKTFGTCVQWMDKNPTTVANWFLNWQLRRSQPNISIPGEAGPMGLLTGWPSVVNSTS